MNQILHQEKIHQHDLMSEQMSSATATTTIHRKEKKPDFPQTISFDGFKDQAAWNKEWFGSVHEEDPVEKWRQRVDVVVWTRICLKMNTAAEGAVSCCPI